jgi:adenine-specific DNA-methyltransferase
MTYSDFRPHTPKPFSDERPAAYADRVGRAVAPFASPERKKKFGQYLTPPEVADFMARACTLDAPILRVLDPGAGLGVLSCALLEALAEGRDGPREVLLEAYEHDPHLADLLSCCLEYARGWLQERQVTLNFRVRTEDFVLAHAQALNNLPSLLPDERHAGGNFDLIISNPPYFKIPKTDHRARAAAAVVHGQPNIYALFMAVSASLLRPGGEMVFIVPRSFAAGTYFRLFREHFFRLVRPTSVHLFGSRRDAFGRDEVLQENIILAARRVGGLPMSPNGGQVEVSFSEGMKDLAARKSRRLPLSEVLDVRCGDTLLRIPVADDDEEIARAVRSWSGSLHAYGLEISTGPVVPFRAAQLLSRSGDIPNTHAPLLWMQNVTPMRVEWPVGVRGKAQYIEAGARSGALLVPDRNYVLMRRFSAKESRRRLIAAPLITGTLNSPHLGFENHLNYVHRPGGSLSESEAVGLAALFNSSTLDTYFRAFNGNTQVSATEMRAMPLPPLELIKEIGRRVKPLGADALKIDAVVESLLGTVRCGMTEKANG